MSTKRDTPLISRLQVNIYGGVIVDKIIVSEILLEIF
jgi:hypothetical protein